MKRIKLPIEIDCGKEIKTVNIEYVYNYVYDQYNELIAYLGRLKEIAKEINTLESEINTITIKGGALVVAKKDENKTKYSDLKELIKTRTLKSEEVKVLRKEASDINEKFIQKNICILAISILKDNEIDDPDLLSVDFWHKKVLPNEAWTFILKAVNKDSSKKKIVGK